MTDASSPCPHCGLRLPVPPPERCPRCARRVDGTVSGAHARAPGLEPVVDDLPPSRTRNFVLSAVVGALAGAAFVVVKHPELRKHKPAPAPVAVVDAGAPEPAPPKVIDAGAVVAVDAKAVDAGAAPVAVAPLAPMSLDATRVYVLADGAGKTGDHHRVVYEWNVQSPNTWGLPDGADTPMVRATDGAVLFVDAGALRFMRPYARATGEAFALPEFTMPPEQHPEGGLGCVADSGGPQNVAGFLVAADSSEIVSSCAPAGSGRWMRKGTALRFDGTPISLGWNGAFLTINGNKLGIERGDGQSALLSEALPDPLKGSDYVAVRAAEDGFTVAFLKPTGDALPFEATVLRVDFRANLRPAPGKYAPVPRTEGTYTGALTPLGDLLLLERPKAGAAAAAAVGKILRYPANGGPVEAGLSEAAAGSEGPHFTATSLLITGP